MRLEEKLRDYNADHLRQIVKVLGGPGPRGTRKEFLTQHILERLTDPASVKELWHRLDPLSQKAVGAALHDGGEFDEEAFFARYGTLPERRGHGGYWSYYARDRELFPLDLFFFGGGIPREMKPFLEGLAPAPERFQLEGLAEAPETLDIDEEKIPLHRADTERAGLQDLMAYLGLVQHGALKNSASSHLLTPKSVRTLFDNLLEGDFVPHEEPVTAKGSIRPFGLDVFARESGLAGRYSGISEAGEAVLLHQDEEALLDAFETWTHEGTFDELGRVRAIKGQNARHTHLTEPAKRREKIVEALSWCPVGVWIPIPDFNRALKIWHHDFDLDLNDYSNLYVDNPIYGRIDGPRGWNLAKALYINTVLWEYLGTIGALDLLFIRTEEHYSLYDGLAHFRINPLGAYLLGQAARYEPSYSIQAPLFEIDASLVLTLEDPESLTVNQRNRIQAYALEQDHGQYRLDQRKILDAIESGIGAQQIAAFLEGWNNGPLPAQATDWLEKIEDHTHAFENAGTALLVKTRSQELLRLVTEDPVLGKFARVHEKYTLVIPASREKAFRRRLKELGYLL